MRLRSETISERETTHVILGVFISFFYGFFSIFLPRYGKSQVFNDTFINAALGTTVKSSSHTHTRLLEGFVAPPPPSSWHTCSTSSHHFSTVKSQNTPNHQQWHAKWKLSRNMYTSHACFRTFGADLHAQLALINKHFRIGAQSEVCYKCVVAWVTYANPCVQQC